MCQQNRDILGGPVQVDERPPSYAKGLVVKPVKLILLYHAINAQEQAILFTILNHATTKPPEASWQSKRLLRPETEGYSFLCRHQLRPIANTHLLCHAT